MSQQDLDRGSRPGPIAKVLRWLDVGVPIKLILAIFAAFAVAGALFIVIGGVDVSADKPDGWVTRHLLHFVFKRSVSVRSDALIKPDDFASPGRIRLAAQHFDMVCANCHGRPGYGQSVVALSMSPRPQYLPNVVGQFTDPQLHQILEHGVRFSAMPAWATDARPDELWSMVAFLRQLPKLDAKSYRELTALPAASPLADTGPDDSAPRPADADHIAPPANEFLYAAPTAGFADSSVHTNPLATCARCHGADGSGAATGGEAPNLTIQDAGYLQAALQAYTQGGRKSGFMRTVAAELSSAQIAALAHYYAGLPVQPSPASPIDPALVKRGEAIALQGVPESATPACANCHDSAGAQFSGAPHIAGQSVTYLRRQLDAMSHGGRGSANWWNPMPAVAHSLDPHEIAAVAAYYASLKPAKAGGAPSQPLALPPTARINLAEAKHIFETQCLKCHVNGGRGDLKGDYPDITLHSGAFVAQNLYAFRSGARSDDMMRQVTGGLGFDQMASLAAYINGLPPQPGVPAPDRAAAARGAEIALHGAPARGVPACVSCHSAGGVAALPLIARLQGQSAPYLHARLDMFAQPQDANLGGLNPMPQIASKLTERERADLAAYFATLPPLAKTAPAPNAPVGPIARK